MLDQLAFEPEPAAAAELEARRLVPVGRSFAATVPERQDAWKWAQDGESFLLLHQTGPEADALVYSEPMRISHRHGRASAEAVRFQREVAPFLASPVSSQGLRLLATPGLTEASAEAGLSPAESLFAAMSLTRRTLGRGLGFQPGTQRFSGWRWIGTNERSTLLRVARIDGTWGQARPLDPSVLALLATLAERSDALAELYFEIDPAAAAPGGFPTGGLVAPTLPTPTPALLLLVHAVSRSGGSGLHMAILCRTTDGSCRVEEKLVDLLRTVGPLPNGQSGSTAGSTGGSDLRQLAGNQGIELLPTGSTPTMQQVTDAVSSFAPAPAPELAAEPEVEPSLGQEPDTVPEVDETALSGDPDSSP